MVADGADHPQADAADRGTDRHRRALSPRRIRLPAAAHRTPRRGGRDGACVRQRARCDPQPHRADRRDDRRARAHAQRAADRARDPAGDAPLRAHLRPRQFAPGNLCLAGAGQGGGWRLLSLRGDRAGAAVVRGGRCVRQGRAGGPVHGARGERAGNRRAPAYAPGQHPDRRLHAAGRQQRHLHVRHGAVRGDQCGERRLLAGQRRPRAAGADRHRRHRAAVAAGDRRAAGDRAAGRLPGAAGPHERRADAAGIHRRGDRGDERAWRQLRAGAPARRTAATPQRGGAMQGGDRQHRPLHRPGRPVRRHHPAGDPAAPGACWAGRRRWPGRTRKATTR